MIIVLLADGFEEIEALTPVDMLRRAGLEVKTVGINGKIAVGSHGIPIVCDAISEDINLDDVSMAIFPGGMPGALNLDASPYTDEVINNLLSRNGHLAAICAAPLIFGRRGLLNGKTATCYPGFEKELIGANVKSVSVVTDGSITTARGMGAAIKFAEELLTICVGEQKASEISGSICKPSDEELYDLDIISTEEHNEQNLDNIVKKITKPDFSGYTAPALDLLEEEKKPADDYSDIELNQFATKIASILSAAGVRISIAGFERGPRFTTLRIVSTSGPCANKIRNLREDITLALGVSTMRIVLPVPGESEIKFEIPNKSREDVKLRPLLESEEFQSSESCTTVCIGRDVAGNPIISDIAKMPHAIIGGMVASGKTCLINSMITSLIYKANPSELKLIIIDPKECEFIPFEGIPHLLAPVISSPLDAVGALTWVLEEVERRYNLLRLANVRNIDAYNKKVKEEPSFGNTLPKIVVFIDELADLMLAAKEQTEYLLMRIAQKSRAAGIYTITATHRPTQHVLTGLLRANIPTRFCFKVTSSVDSKTLIDYSGGEMLMGKGDALYCPIGAITPIRIQSAVVSDSEIQSVTSAAKSIGTSVGYNPVVMDYIKNKSLELAKKHPASKKKIDQDEEREEGYLSNPQFLEAVELTVITGHISTSLIQRKLSIGYGKAAKFIDVMEDMGIIGSSDGMKPRKALITVEEWKKRLATTK